MKIYLILAGILLALLIAMGAVLFFLSQKPVTTTPPPSNTGFPIASSTVNQTGISGPSTTMNITLPDKSTVTTKDFIHNNVTVEDPANPGAYYLAGSSGACKPDGTCPTAGTQTDFTVVYHASDQSFIIGLATEPLGAVRKEAEQYLMQQLGLSEQQMCELNYSVLTTTYVNQQYGGENLGFSFCPGAVQLP